MDKSQNIQMRDEKEERKKQARSNKQTRQSNTAHPRQSLFLEKMSCLRWDSINHKIIQMRDEKKERSKTDPPRASKRVWLRETRF